MPTVDYPISFPYRTIPSVGYQPAVEVELKSDGFSARAVAIVDSGSNFSVFSGRIAEILGIANLTDGLRQRVVTYGGPAEFYLFDLDIRVIGYGDPFRGQIGFSEGHTPRNILGRIVFFSRFQVGFRESQQRIYLRHE